MNDDKYLEEYINLKRPKSRYNVVKVGFWGNYVYRDTNKKSMRLHVLIGEGVAKKLGWKEKDWLHIEPTPSHLLLYKIDPSHFDDSEYCLFKGFRFNKVRHSHSFDVSISCNFMRPPKNRRTRTVAHEQFTKEGTKFLKVSLKDIYMEDE